MDEIADHLGIKWNTLYKWIGGGPMQAHKIWRLLKFKKDEEDEWFKTGGTQITTRRIRTNE